MSSEENQTPLASNVQLDSQMLLLVLQEIVEHALLSNKVELGTSHTALALTYTPNDVEFCVLTDDCNSSQWSLIKELCTKQKVKLIHVPSSDVLKSWTGYRCYCMVIGKFKRDSTAAKALLDYIEEVSRFFDHIDINPTVTPQLEYVVQNTAASVATTVSSSIASTITSATSAVSTATTTVSTVAQNATNSVTTANVRDAIPSTLNIETAQIDAAAIREATTAIKDAKETFDKSVVEKSSDWVVRVVSMICSLVTTVPAYANRETFTAAGIITGAAAGIIFVAFVTWAFLR